MGIALCMIVKNEEDWIEGAVQSVSSIVSEVIIVDTGSVDRTCERAQHLGAKVLTHPWQDSFAAARNRSLAEAKEPWILVLDADERVASRDLPIIVEATKSLSAAGHHLIQRNYVFDSHMFGWSPNAGTYDEGRDYAGYVDNALIRLFRNSPDLRFRGSVHEIIDPNELPRNLKFENIPAVIHHYGKVRESEHVAKKQRLYLSLGLKKVEEDPKNAKAYFDLGIQYQELGRHEEALPCFDQSFKMTGLPLVLLYQAISEKHLKHFDVASALLRRAVQLGLNSVEVHLELGNVSLALGSLTEARREYETCLKINPENPTATFNQGLVLRKMGEATQAENFYKRALKLNPDFYEPALELANAYSERRLLTEAIDLLRPLVRRNPNDRSARLLLVKVYIQANDPDRALEALGNPALGDAAALCLAGAAHFQKEELDQAQLYFEAALRRDRSLRDARINLAQIFARKGDHARAARYSHLAGTR